MYYFGVVFWCCILESRQDYMRKLFVSVLSFCSTKILWRCNFLLITGRVNILHTNISMHILHTVLYSFLKVLTRRIWSKIKSFSSWLSFPLFLPPLLFHSHDWPRQFLLTIIIKLNTILSRQVMRIKKNISKGIICWFNTKFSKLTS